MKNLIQFYVALFIISAAVVLESCDDDDDNSVEVHDINTAEKVTVDRFSADAGTLMVRDGSNGLPAANAPINFDQAPFITKGLGPSGENVEYYNFDVQPVGAAPIYVLFKEGSSTPVPNQLNIIDDIPGDDDYNDFWQVHKVTVPSNYKANQVASLDEIMAAGYTIEQTPTLVNCPVVPEGSTASKRLPGGATGLVMGWYKEKIVFYFTFDEKALMASGENVPTSPIFVCFNTNVSEPGGGPASGFKTEMGTDQTHNVVATIPSDATYSPLWWVNAYDNSDFDAVDDLTSAEGATEAGTGLATVNCPIVSIE